MRIRDDMPELEGAGVWYNSEGLKRADLIGKKATLFHFWSVSCELCKKAIPRMNQFRDEYKDELQVIAVHMPRSEKDLQVEQVLEVAKEYHMTQPIFVDNEHILTDAFHNDYVPAYYVFDERGQLRYRQAGGGGMRMLEKRLTRVLDK